MTGGGTTHTATVSLRKFIPRMSPKLLSRITLIPLALVGRILIRLIIASTAAMEDVKELVQQFKAVVGPDVADVDARRALNAASYNLQSAINR